MKTIKQQTSIKNSGNFKFRSPVFIAVLLISFMMLPSVASAGQNWSVTIVNNNGQEAQYLSYSNKNCWYPGDFANGFSIAANTTVVKATEEKWAVFEDCGGASCIITLSFLVFGTDGLAAVCNVTLVDIDERSAPGTNPIICGGNSAHGNPTAAGWAWAGGKAPKGVNPPVITCNKPNGQETTNITITLPTFS